MEEAAALCYAREDYRGFAQACAQTGGERLQAIARCCEGVATPAHLPAILAEALTVAPRFVLDGVLPNLLASLPDRTAFLETAVRVLATAEPMPPYQRVEGVVVVVCTMLRQSEALTPAEWAAVGKWCPAGLLSHFATAAAQALAAPTMPCAGVLYAAERCEVERQPEFLLENGPNAVLLHLSQATDASLVPLLCASVERCLRAAPDYVIHAPALPVAVRRVAQQHGGTTPFLARLFVAAGTALVVRLAREGQLEATVFAALGKADLATREAVAALWPQRLAPVLTASPAPPAVKHAHTCPITLETISDPVVASDGGTYERDAILTVIAAEELARSPLTRDYLSPFVAPQRLLLAPLPPADPPPPKKRARQH